MNLVEGACASDDGHGAEVDGVLDWCNLAQMLEHQSKARDAYAHTNKLLTKICKILAFSDVRPAKSFCKIVMRTWPTGAMMNAPLAAIFGTRDVK